ncbi:uncharacterized protein LOC144141986 [Haemaphysalis longicornis]
MFPKVVRAAAVFAAVCGCIMVLLEVGSTCNTQVPPHGPRLMKAKKFFGDVMRRCSKEITAVVKQVQPSQARKLILWSCQFFNICKESVPAGIDARIAIHDCLVDVLRNESAPAYSRLKIPKKEYEEASIKAADCMWDVPGHEDDLMQVIDDVVAFGVRAAINYGWA